MCFFLIFSKHKTFYNSIYSCDPYALLTAIYLVSIIPSAPPSILRVFYFQAQPPRQHRHSTYAPVNAYAYGALCCVYTHLTVLGWRGRMVGWWCLYYERRKLNAEPKHTHKCGLTVGGCRRRRRRCRRGDWSLNRSESHRQPCIMGRDTYLYTSHHITHSTKDGNRLICLSFLFILTSNSFLFFLCFSFHFIFIFIFGKTCIMFCLN